MTNNVAYDCEIENMIISNLDGWVVQAPASTSASASEVDVQEEEETETTQTTTITSTDTTDTGVQPFMTTTELSNKANKVITRTECRLFYEEALEMSYLHTNRLNIEDLTSIEAKTFLRAVCRWAASNLWNKYNIRVNNEDLEDTYIQSYGGLLYKSALKTLQPFINQRINSMSHIRENDDATDDDIWII